MKKAIVRIGDKVELRDGFTEVMGTVYGFETTKWGTDTRIKVEVAGQVRFEWIRNIFEYPPAHIRAIGCYKVA